MASADAGRRPPTGPRSPQSLGPAAADELLRSGRLEVVGRLVAASNVTLLCRISGPGSTGAEPVADRAQPVADRVQPAPDRAQPAPDRAAPPFEALCVYKPTRGEAPLWDFPAGTLARREVAARLVSEATGWEIVPPTVLRDGPYGPGMVQLWLEVDSSVDVVALIRANAPVLRPVALFDAVINNADRKAGHLLPLPGGRIHGVDHGVCFSPDPKLRTVLWGWMGSPLEEDELVVLRRLRGELDGSLGAALAQLLAPDEVAATARRIERLLDGGRFPVPDPGWPAVPWPWY